MTSLNIEKLYSKFREISDSIGRLRAFGDTALEAFLNDQDKQDIASFRLIVATEAAIDICLHVAATVIRKVPEEYAGCFMLLSEHGLIDKSLAIRLAQMARFRNLLVHQYWEIDYARMYQIITGSDLDDLNEFTAQIKKVVEEHNPSESI